jgi:undecaprenyl-diphosphatase
MFTRKLSLIVFAIVAFSIAVMPAPAFCQTATINLGYLVPKAPTEASKPLSESSKLAYDCGVIGVGGLIAADDRGIYRTIQGPNGPSKAETSAASDASKLGDLMYVAPALGALYLTGGSENRDIAWKSGLAVARAGIIGLTLKETIGRARPDGAQGGSADTFHPFKPSSERFDSFPSGHTLVAFSVATVWADERPSQRYEAYGLATAVGLSRIVTGAHWPSDVFWGAVLGVTQGRQAVKGNADLLTIRF